MLPRMTGAGTTAPGGHAGRASLGRRAVSRLVRPVTRARARRAIRRSQRKRYVLLLRHLDGKAGVCRSVINLANGLHGAGLDVTVLALFRRPSRPHAPLDPGIKVQYVRDIRPRAIKRLTRRQVELDGRPTVLAEKTDHMTALTDRRLRRALRGLGPCTLISHRPILHEAAARWAPPHVVLLAVEHTDFDLRPESYRERMVRIISRLDRVAVLTEENRKRWSEVLGSAEKVVTVPNATPFELGATRDSWDARVVLAAGNLVPRKGFDRLIRAFAPLAGAFPDWELRIFGSGPDADELAALIASEGLDGRAHLPGHTRSLEREMRAASIYAMSSHSEGLPMVVLEAMGAGLPVVAFDAPGARDLVADGTNGYLVPDNDLTTFTEALSSLMASSELRASFGRASQAEASTYHPRQVVSRWREVVREVT
jgi:glycosyltransferase involved in cell wall biosynthesis